MAITRRKKVTTSVTASDEKDNAAPHRRAVAPLKGKSPRQGGATLADRLAALEAKHKMKAHVYAEDADGDGDEENVRVWLEAVDDKGAVKIGGDRVSAEGSSREEAITNLEAKLGGSK